MKRENVEIVVGKISIKKWLNDENHQYYMIFQKVLNDPQTHPLKLITSSDEVYIINYNAEFTTASEEDNRFESRVFLTDLINTMDFTFFTMFSELIGCDVQELEDYPEEVLEVITDYAFGEKGDLVNPKEEVRKYNGYYELMKQNDKIIDRKFTANKNKVERFFELLGRIAGDADSDRLTNISEIFREHGNPENKSPLDVINSAKETIVNNSQNDLKNELQLSVVRFLGQVVYGNFYFSIYYLSQIDETYEEIINEMNNHGSSLSA